MIDNSYIAFTNSETNHSKPLLFRSGRSSGSPSKIYSGIYSTFVTTNGVGTWFTALDYKQSAGFDAEDGTAFFPSDTNRTFKAWGGTSNTFEVLVPTVIRSNLTAQSISASTNALDNWPTAAASAGGWSIQNSNATVYILTSTPNSTTWAATNKIAGP
jgi:hypothetical protein